MIFATETTTGQGLPLWLMNVGQLAFWLLSVPIAAVTAWRAIIEIRESRKLRERELRERKATLARDLLSTFDNERNIQAVHQVVDYDTSEVEIRPGVTIPVDQAFLIRSIRVDNIVLTPDEFALREEYVDRMLVFIETLEHHIDADLIVFSDVSYRLDYFVDRMSDKPALFKAFKAYIDEFKYVGVSRFLSRFGK